MKAFLKILPILFVLTLLLTACNVNIKDGGSDTKAPDAETTADTAQGTETGDSVEPPLIDPADTTAEQTTAAPAEQITEEKALALAEDIFKGLIDEDRYELFTKTTIASDDDAGTWVVTRTTEDGAEGYVCTLRKAGGSLVSYREMN